MNMNYTSRYTEVSKIFERFFASQGAASTSYYLPLAFGDRH
jgi:hypothetical protein